MRALQQWVEAALRERAGFELAGPLQPAGGGTWSAWRGRLRDGRRFFCKAGDRVADGAFSAEAGALRRLGRADPDRVVVPEVLACVEADGRALLALEWIDMRGQPSIVAVAHGLAAIRDLDADAYGWPTPSVLGRCPLPAFESADPVAALFEGRIAPLLRQAGRNDWSERLQRIRGRLTARSFPGAPAMTHGDFWGGNHGADARGRLVVFDPAPMQAGLWWDLGFLEAFSPASATAVRDVLEHDYAYPAQDARTAELLAQLVIMLAHVAMFGGGYVAHVERLLRQLEQV